MFGLKPMNCPESTLRVSARPALATATCRCGISEIGRLHRNERSGTLTGLVRVRQFTQDDAHIYCRPDQLLDEITGVLDLVRECYELFGLEPLVSRLRDRPPQNLGTDEQWDQAEEALHEALRDQPADLRLDRGDGAFYGPKIDIDVEDALGRQWQLATIQLDLTMLPERFDSEYIDSDGSRSGRWSSTGRSSAPTSGSSPS